MNKRGAAGLPMDTLIIAIIAIIVLLLIITFFTGGLGTIGEKLRDIFGKSTSGYDVNVARNFCTDYCNAAKRLVDEKGALDQDQIKKSAYCNEKFDIKRADKLETGQQCWDLGITCGSINKIYCGK